MSSSFRDPAGTVGALLVGAAIGLAFAAPMVPGPAAVSAPDVSVGPVGGYLLVGVLVMAAVPLCIALLYVVAAAMDS